MNENTEKEFESEFINGISLQDFMRIILNQKWIIILVFITVFGSTIYYIKTAPYIYQSKVFMMRETATEKLPASIIGIDIQPEKPNKGQDMLLKSSALLTEIQKQLAQKYGIDVSTDQLIKWLSLSSPKDSADVVQMIAKGNSPKQAQAIANTASEVYISKQSEMKKSELNQGLLFLQQQVDQIEAKIQGTERALSNFRDKEEIIASTTDTESGGLLGKLGNIQSDLVQAENDAELTNTQLQTIEKLIEEKKKYAKSATTSGVSAQMDQIRERLVILQLDLSARMETRTEKDPEVISIKKKIEFAESQLKTEFDRLLSGTGTGSLDPISELQNLMSQYITLTVQLKSSEKRAALMKERLNQFRAGHPELATKQVELVRLERQSRIYEQAYTTLTSKYEDMRLMEQMKVVGLKIIDPAPLPKSPISPKVNKLITLGVLLGLFLGVGIVIFLHCINDTINTEEDAQRYIDLPALGTIPKIVPYDVQKSLLNLMSNKPNGNESSKSKKKNSSVDHKKEVQSLLGHSLLYAPKDSDKNSAKESYRNLAVNIQFASIDKPLKMLLVTSSIPGEGKTTTSSNLAITMARPDNSVLLVDADIRRPKVHRIFRQDRSPGLTDLLALGTEISGDVISSHVHPTAINNLYILPCGSHISNTESLFASQKMQAILDALKQGFDMIIIDSPPILSVADSVALSNKVDGVLLVTFSGKTSGKLVSQAKNALERVSANIIGTLVTNVDYAKHYGYYHYYRYYHYYQHYMTEDSDGSE
jgi:polysaccharide biosynthesis transport protein